MGALQELLNDFRKIGTEMWTQECWFVGDSLYEFSARLQSSRKD